MKKLLLVVAMVLSTVFLFTACSDAKTTDVTGTYVYAYDEEIGGDNIHIENRITLKDDNVCIVDFQDTITGTWDADGTITINGEKSHFSVKGNKMFYKMDEESEPMEFIKE